MITETITPLPIAPSTSDPVNFRARGDAFLSALNQFDDEMNTVISEINSTAQTINDTETSAVQAKDAAVSSANFQGTWSSGTAYTVGQSVAHNGIIYRALQAGTNQQPDTQTAYWVSIATASEALLALINQKAPLASPTFTGTPTAPTPTTDYQVANKKYVDDKVNKPCFSAYKNDENQPITSGVSTKVTFTTEEYGRTGAYDITNSRFTPSVDGIYHVISQADVSGGTDVQLRLYKNGSPVRGARSTWTFTANSKFQFSCDIELVESDYVEMYITITGSTPVVYPSKSTFFQAHYVRS